MSKINYKKAREMLSQSCERYIVHNQEQLDALIAESSEIPADSFFYRALGSYGPNPGVARWLACEYAYLFDHILDLDSRYTHRSVGYVHYEERYTPCALKTTFFPDGDIKPDYFNSRDYVAPSLVLDRLTVLVGLMHHIMVNENKEPDFNKRLEEYKSKNESDYLCLDSDPPSVHIYKTLMNLKLLISFVDTLPDYHPRYITFLLRHLTKSLPTFEGYIKGIAIQELKAILDDSALSDEDSLEAVASQLENATTLEILEKNRQSQTEQILKVLSVALIAVGIGVIPTLFLAAKRLYDTKGSSINFFKPLSQNLYEDAKDVTSNIEKSL